MKKYSNLKRALQTGKSVTCFVPKSVIPALAAIICEITHSDPDTYSSLCIANQFVELCIKDNVAVFSFGSGKLGHADCTYDFRFDSFIDKLG